MKKLRFILPILIPIILIGILSLLKVNGSISEWWSRTIARGLNGVFGAVTSLVDFSITEILIYLLFISAFAFLVRLIVLICRKQWKKALKISRNLLCIILCYIVLYNIFAGFNYYREKIDFSFTSSAEVSNGIVAQSAEYFLEDFEDICSRLPKDENGAVKSPYDFYKIRDKLIEEYKRLDNNPYFSSFTPKSKKFLMPESFQLFNISGIYIAPLGEANIEAKYLNFWTVFTAAHELAHAKGIMREADANLTTAYILLTSGDEYFRYCGYMNTLYELIEAVEYTDVDLSSQLFDRFNEQAIIDINAYFANERFNIDIISVISRFFNDLYLMSNGIEEGTDNYDGTGGYVDYETDPDTGEIIIDENTNAPVIKDFEYSDNQIAYARIFLDFYR